MKIVIMIIFILYPCYTYAQEITVDPVEGTINGELVVHQGDSATYIFELRYNNDYPNNIIGFTTGYQFWMTGGTRSPIDIDSLYYDNILYSRFDLQRWINRFGNNGVGNDTILLSACNMYGTGFENGYNEIVAKFNVTIYSDAIGEEFCFDKCDSIPPSHEFLWSDGDNVIPYFWGPHCYDISEAPEERLTVIGKIEAINPSMQPPNNTYPLKGIRIQLWDDDLFPYTDDLLADTVTDELGNFEFEEVSNEDGLYGRQDIYLRILGCNNAGRFYIDTTFNELLSNETDSIIDEVPSGTYDYNTLILNDLYSSQYFILNTIRESFDEWTDVCNVGYPDSSVCRIVFSYSGSGFNITNNYIKIDSTYETCNKYNKFVIMHEHAHNIEEYYYFFDASPGGDHDWADSISNELAASEGFASFWSCFVQDTSIFHYDSWGYQRQRDVNLENGEITRENTWGTLYEGSFNNYGAINEGAVAGILWDIYDDHDDDYSWWTGALKNGYQDSIMDRLSNGIENIITCLFIETNGSKPDNIFDFITSWQNDSLGHESELLEIYLEHSLTPGVNVREIDEDITLPKEFSLSQNYPNPFNPTTRIDFAIDRRSNVRMVVYNLLGQEVSELVNEKLSKGSYYVTWDGTNKNGDIVATGIYLYRLYTEEYSEAKKMVFLK